MTCRPLFGGHFRLIPHPIITDELLESSPFTRIAKDTQEMQIHRMDENKLLFVIYLKKKKTSSFCVCVFYSGEITTGYWLPFRP